MLNKPHLPILRCLPYNRDFFHLLFSAASSTH